MKYIHIFFDNFLQDPTTQVVSKSLFLGSVTAVASLATKIGAMLAIILQLVSIISFTVAIIVALPKLIESIQKLKQYVKTGKID
jgi:hypothetical protein